MSAPDAARLPFEVVLVEAGAVGAAAQDEQSAASRVVTVACRLAAGAPLDEAAAAGSFAVEWRTSAAPRGGITIEIGRSSVSFDPFEFGRRPLVDELRRLAADTVAALGSSS